MLSPAIRACTETTVAALVIPAAVAVMLAAPARVAGVQTTGVVRESQVPAQTRPLLETTWLLKLRVTNKQCKVW